MRGYLSLFDAELIRIAEVMPLARVVLLENASHDVFQSNESEILRDMNEFIKSLPKPSDRPKS